MRRIDLCKGDVFGHLTVIGLCRNNKGHRLWQCRCRCGNITEQSSFSLRSGAVVSCGCHKLKLLVSRNTTHGDSKSPEHRAWENMIIRCENRNAPYFKYYGARGIKVCKRWRDSYELFLKDMGRKPFPKAELDRIDNNGDYEPGNCRWATRKQQLRNMRVTNMVTIEGVTKSLAEWSEISGVHRATIKYRIKAGWDLKSAVFVKPLSDHSSRIRKWR